MLLQAVQGGDGVMSRKALKQLSFALLHRIQALYLECFITFVFSLWRYACRGIFQFQGPISLCSWVKVAVYLFITRNAGIKESSVGGYITHGYGLSEPPDFKVRFIKINPHGIKRAVAKQLEERLLGTHRRCPFANPLWPADLFAKLSLTMRKKRSYWNHEFQFYLRA